MKKILAMLLSVAIIATIAIGGSIAYLQDTDETVNTMVMGNVDIEQIEQERKEGTDELITFRNAQKLYPATYYLTSSEPTLPNSEAREPEHVPGGFYKNVVGAMDKIVSVKNVGKSDAYIRTWFAFEADNEDSLKYIHRNWNTQPDSTGEFANGKYVEIAGNGYIVFCVTYPEAIKAGESTPVSLMQVCMDKAATNEYVEQFGDTYEILVLSQGVQAENFEDAAQAFTNAFGNQHPWTGRDTIAVPTIVKTEAELMAAINSIGSLQADKSINITLGANITLSENWSAPSFNKFEGANGNVTIVIDGNGYSINGLTVNSNNESAGLIGKLEGDVSFTARNLTLNNVSLTGNNTNSGYSCGGALIGYCGAWNSPVIDNVTVNGVNITGYKYIGGLIGYETTDSAGLVKKAVTVSNCSVNNATLNSTFTKPSEGQTGDVGGLIGQAYSAKLTGNTVKDTIITGSTGENRHGAMIGTAQAPVVIGTGRVENVKINDTPVKSDANSRKIVGSVDNRNDKSDSVTVSYDASTIASYIGSKSELVTFATSANASHYATYNVVLTSDIDMQGEELPCMSVAYQSSVTFEGNGHTISNVKIAKSNFNTMTSYGMFFVWDEGTLTVNNLTIKNASVAPTEGNYGAAVIVGYTTSGKIILNNVKVLNSSVANENGNAGMLVGYTCNTVNLTNCTVSGTVTGHTGDVTTEDYKFHGAYVGFANTSNCKVTMKNCTNSTGVENIGCLFNGATSTNT